MFLKIIIIIKNKFWFNERWNLLLLRAKIHSWNKEG